MKMQTENIEQNFMLFGRVKSNVSLVVIFSENYI